MKVEGIRVFRYLDCFSVCVVKIAVYMGCDLCFVKVIAVFGGSRMLRYYFLLVL